MEERDELLAQFGKLESDLDTCKEGLELIRRKKKAFAEENESVKNALSYYGTAVDSSDTDSQVQSARLNEP